MNRNGSKDKRYWFPAKTFGWGWGPPATREGWLVLVGYFVALVVGIVFWPPEEGHLLRWLAYTAVITAVLLAICWKKGEPPKWRWGERD